MHEVSIAFQDTLHVVYDASLSLQRLENANIEPLIRS